MTKIGLCWCEACAYARKSGERKFGVIVGPHKTVAPTLTRQQIVHVAAPAAKAPAAPTMKSQLTGIINGMTPQERSSFGAGYAKAQQSGFLGSQETYLSQQAALQSNKRTLPGDPKVTSALSAGTLGKYTTLRNAQSSTPTAAPKPAAAAGKAGPPGPGAPAPNVPKAVAKPLPPQRPYAMPKPVHLPTGGMTPSAKSPAGLLKAPSAAGAAPKLPTGLSPSAGAGGGGGNTGESRDPGGKWTQASEKHAFQKDEKGHGSNKRGEAGPAGDEPTRTLTPSDVRFKVGDTARFDGHSADGRVTGSMDVKIVNPHSNASSVTHSYGTGKRQREYENAHTHIPTATVQNLRGTQFEAFHHTLSRKGETGRMADSPTNPPHRVKSPKGSAQAPPTGIAPVGGGHV